jgi:hypothetical protein
MNDYTEVIDEFRNTVIPQIFKKDFLPGYSRPTLIQLERNINRMIKNKADDNISLQLTAIAIILGELLVKTVEGIEWMYESPDLQMLRLKLPTAEGEDSLYILPVTKVMNYFKTRSSNDSIVRYYDSIVASIKTNDKKGIVT